MRDENRIVFVLWSTIQQTIIILFFFLEFLSSYSEVQFKKNQKIVYDWNLVGQGYQKSVPLGGQSRFPGKEE